ncbi:MAG: ATP-binding protein [bacterium]|nr:ATP-binding protein [bacterium]
MRILIAYYSKKGRTEKVADTIKAELEGRGHKIDIEKIKPAREHNFLSWFFIRIFRGECQIQTPRISDVSGYDAICLGSPNWTRVSLPLARYIKEVEGIKYKNVGFFATTTLWPFIEWYILSAYLLNSTFSRIVEKRKGRVVSSIMLSSFFRRWSYSSQYGQKTIRNFCDKISVPITSFKEYFLEQKEIESTRFLVILFSLILSFSLLYQFISPWTGYKPLDWSEYFPLFVIVLFSYLSLLTVLASKTWVFGGKYLIGITLPVLLTLLPLFLAFSQGQAIIFGYILILILISFFREPKAVLFTGAIIALSYGYLLFTYPSGEVLLPSTDIPILLLSLGMISFITNGLKKHYIDLLEAQDEIEVARRRAETEKEKTMTIITNFADGLLVFDKTKKLSLINPQAEKFFQIKGEKVTGKRISEFGKTPSVKPLFVLLGDRIKKVFRKELTVGEDLVLEASTVPIASGKEKEPGTLVILHDVSREKIIERMKTEFVSLVAHQLKSPLSAIKWTLKMLMEGDLGKITQKQSEFIGKTYDANERMISLINDLLNVARIEEGRYVYNPVLTSIEDLVQKVIDFSQGEIKNKKIRLEFEKPKTKLPQVSVDAEKIELAIQNFLDNAVKYTSPGGKVTISLKGGIKKIEVSVADTGIGIPENQQKRVFTKFFRAANAMRTETEGTGLGLFIVKNIIRAHGGEAWFESKEGKGTTFHFTLPVKNIK